MENVLMRSFPLFHQIEAEARHATHIDLINPYWIGKKGVPFWKFFFLSAAEGAFYNHNFYKHLTIFYPTCPYKL